MDLAALRSLAESHHARRLELRATDLLGRWHQLSMPLGRLAFTLSDGVRFEADRVAGWPAAGQPGFGGPAAPPAELRLIPDPSTAVIDPLAPEPVLVLVSEIIDPDDGDPVPLDARSVARRAEAHLRAATGGLEAWFGPVSEFTVLDGARFTQAPSTALFAADPPGLPIERAAPEVDGQADLRQILVWALGRAGLEVTGDLRGPAEGGRAEIATAHRTLLRKADETQWYRYLVRNATRAAGQVATFMPLPFPGARTNGLAVHQSLGSGIDYRFFDPNGYAGLSQLARWYLSGLLLHAPALLALTCPTTNSYRRLAVDPSTPAGRVFGLRNRSALVRVPAAGARPAASRLEFRAADGAANPYLAFAAMLMAGLDGIRRELDPGDPLERDLRALPPRFASLVPRLPASLDVALDALEEDRAFLEAGGVFPSALLDAWIALKRAEAAEDRLRPTPEEFALYFDA